MWVQSPGWEDPLEEGLATHSSILACRVPMDRELATVHGVAKSWTRLKQLSTRMYASPLSLYASLLFSSALSVSTLKLILTTLTR